MGNYFYYRIFRYSRCMTRRWKGYSKLAYSHLHFMFTRRTASTRTAIVSINMFRRNIPLLIIIIDFVFDGVIWCVLLFYLE